MKTGEGDDPIGVTTVFNLRRNAKLAPLAEFKDFLLGRITRTADQDHLRTVGLY